MNITSINCRGRLLEFSHAKIMGILNVTPDSFYDGGIYDSSQKIIKHTQQMIMHGAEIIDIGGVSTRPGSKAPSEKEEMDRLKPVISLVRKEFPDIFISVDTYRSDALKMASDLGADIANDISAGSLDTAYLSTVADIGIPYILMHMQGNPANMQSNPINENVTHQVLKFFIEKLDQLKALGVEDVILDPGFGFGKSLDQNYRLLSQLNGFRFLEKPILSGTSNKSMIYKVVNTSAHEILSANAILYYEALCNGADILRVHDVKEAAEAIKIYNQLKKVKS